MSYIDEIIQEVESMTPDYGFNVCLFSEFGETKLSLLGHFDTFDEAQEFGNQFENDTVYIYGNEDAKEVSKSKNMSVSKNHNIDKYVDMAEKDYEEGTNKPNDEYEKVNYSGEFTDSEEQKAYNYLNRSEKPEMTEDLERWAINAGVPTEVMIRVYDKYFSGESVDDLKNRRSELESQLQNTDGYNTSQRIRNELNQINNELKNLGHKDQVYTVRGSDDKVIWKYGNLEDAKTTTRNHKHNGAYIVDELTGKNVEGWESMANEDIYDHTYDSMTEDQKRMYNTLPYEEEDSNEINKTEYLQLVSVINGESYESKCKTCGKLLDYEGYNYCEDDCPHTQDTEETSGWYVSCTGCGKTWDNETFTKYSLLTDLPREDLNTTKEQNNNGMDDSDEVYAEIYNLANEQIGQGIKGHQPWMRQLKYGGEQNKLCTVCKAYTDQSDGKCIVCGNSELSIEVRKMYHTEAFSPNISKYDPSDPDYQYLLDYPNDGAVDKEDQAVPRETLNEVMSMPATGKTCLSCGYYDEAGIGDHTCS